VPRKYASIATAIWRDRDFLALSPSPQRAYMLLISQEEISAAGTLPLTLRRWSRLTAGGTVEQVRADLVALERARYVVTDEDTEELLVRSFVRWDGGYNNPKRQPVIIRAALAITSPAIRWAIRCELDRLGLPTDGLPDSHPDSLSDRRSRGTSGGLPGPVDNPVDSPDDLVRPPPVDNPVDNPKSQVDSLSDSLPDRDAASDGVVVVTEVFVAGNPQPTTHNPQPTTPRPLARPEADRLCEHLADRIQANGCRRPTITKGWRDAARLMLDKDGRTERQITDAIDWATADEFWRANILSMPKLREQYDRLRLAAQRGRAPTNGHRKDIDWEAAMLRANAREDHP